MSIKTPFLFDLDGVIIDSETEYSRIWREIDRRFPTGVKDIGHIIKGSTLQTILSTYFRREDAEEITGLLYEMEAAIEYRYCEGAYELLQELAARGVPRALITSSNDDKMTHLREQHPELEGMFDAVITADRITRSKPDPEGYLLGASMLGVHPSHCFVVEDSVQGMRAGRAAGATVIGISGTLPHDVVCRESDLPLTSLTMLEPDILLSDAPGFILL